MNEYEICCRGVYRGMEWTVIKWNSEIFTARVNPIFFINKQWELTQQRFILNEYREYVGKFEKTIENAKKSIMDVIDFLWNSAESDRITLFPATVLQMKNY